MLRRLCSRGIFCLLATTTLCFAQPQGGRTITIAAPGDRTPDGDHIDFPDEFALGDNGSVFSAQLVGANVLGVFSKVRATETEILRIGDTFTDAGTVTALDDALWINSLGKVLVSATTTDTNSITHNTLLCGTAKATMQTVVLSDETVPDGNGQFDNLVNATLNNRGDVGFWASIKNSTAAVSPTNAVFIGHADGTITQIARSGQPAPGETNLFYSMGFPTPINLKGQLSFAAEINDSQIGTGNNYGLYRSSIGGLIKLARSFDVAPNTPFLLGFLQAGGVNDGGDACFYASLITSDGSFKGFGLFRSSNGTDLQTIAYYSQNVPGGLGQYTAFDSVIDINNTGQVAYTGYFTGATSGSGIFIGDGVTQSALVVSGQRTPDGSTFTSFGSSRINDQGLVLFLAQLDNGPGFNAIFVANGTQVIRVAKVGDIINGIEIASIGFDSKALNNRNQVIYEAIDASGDSRILSFTPKL